MRPSVNSPPALSILNVGHGSPVHAEPLRYGYAIHSHSDEFLYLRDGFRSELSARLGALRSFKGGGLFAVHLQALGPSRNVVGNGVSTDAVLLCDIPSGNSSEVVRDYGIPHLAGDDLIPASKLVGAIPHIVKPSPHTEMVGIDASWIVAGVKNVLSGLNRAISIFVAKPVGKLLVVVSKTPATEHSVSSVVLAGCPLPTSVRRALVNLEPKSVIKHMHIRCDYRDVCAG